MAMAMAFPTTTVNLSTTSSAPQFYQNTISPIAQLELNSLWRTVPAQLSFADIEETYAARLALNIGRSMWSRGDPNTYQSIPVHIWHKRKHALDTSGIINASSFMPTNPYNQLPATDKDKIADPEAIPFGSNVNPLVPDPIGHVHLTPGCVAVVSYLQKGQKRAALAAPKTSLVRNASQLITRTLIADNLNKRLQTTDSILTSVNGRVLNVMAVSPLLVSPENTVEPVAPALGEMALASDVVSSLFRKEFTTGQNLDTPLLRIVFSLYVISALAVFDTTSERLDIAVGFTNGDIFWVDLLSEKIKYSRFNKNGKIINSGIVSITWSQCGQWLIVGFANGEVAIFDRAGDDAEMYPKQLESAEKYLAVYKSMKSGYFAEAVGKKGPGVSNPVAHYKLSNKPITSITINSADANMLSITSDDGYTRLMDLPLTKRPVLSEKVSDMLPGYFGGVLCSAFSPDGKFLAIGGEDDLIAIYQLSYVNLGQLIHKTLSGGGSQASFMGGSTTLATHNILNVKLVARLEGHKSWVRDIKFDLEKCPPVDTSSPVTYRIGSVGDDSRLFFWDFNPKSVPKVKKQPSSTKPKKEKKKLHHQRQRSGEITLPHVSSSSHMQQIHQLLRSANSTNLLTGLNQASASTLELVEHFTRNYETTLHRNISNKDMGYVLPVLEVDLNIGKMSGVIFDGRQKLLWGVCKSGDIIRWSKN
ncbi:hypothetical protein BABINDRAFT_163843 [Babjeviella inositovora NRRL Y-12698]|uniref:Uncharacterized protein n=1 Tax=Babjeviella inositovora NRRL Y-12698 TaxID=984486 RepID=A0A1E3QHC6_9ASCO|nr:uncharacterized protein BABINDRAFT_163843 [Babjeviella inositovora NRRL Y-12698]ODQ77113.1 hypothetical protein BABINDRAFT_163843 [Babjeviella inositovora NRRL Y-12698]